MTQAIASGVLTLATVLASGGGESAQPSEVSAVANNLHGFDFLPGKWRVHNRRLVQRLHHSNEWVEFDATSEARALLNGIANEDEFRTDYWPNFIGMSFRFFDAASNRWSIYWMDTRNAKMDPPVVGGFDGPIGTFVGNDVFEGKPIVVRFIWSRTDTSTPRWEQAFSSDGGKSWETNWIMDFTRIK